MSASFNEMFTNASKIEFDLGWKNGKWNLTFIVYDPKVPEGISAFTDNYGRKAVVGKKGDEVFIVFEFQKHDPGHYECHESLAFRTRLSDAYPEHDYPFSGPLQYPVPYWYNVDYTTYVDWALDELRKLA